MIEEYFKIAIKNLRTCPLRSWLTILGIVIGVFLIISLLSLSEGLKNAVLKELNMMGKDLIIILPGQLGDIMTTFMGGAELSEEDIRTIKKTEGVNSVVPLTMKAGVMKYEGKGKTVMLTGLPWKESLSILQSDLGWSLKEGRWPEPGKRELLIGSLVPEDIFPGMRIGKQATVGGRQFEIVGVLKSLGSKQDDSLVCMDLEMFQNITGAKGGAISAVAKISPGYSPEEVAQSLKERLNETRKRVTGEETPSFSVLTSEKAGGIVSNIMAILQLVIFGFASIAIIVGGIGIMNTMYTSVRERTREIGILKAIGAENSAITSIFLVESGIIGLIGGIGGTILGLMFAKSIEMFVQIHPVFYMEAAVSPFLIIFGLAFSFSIGCLSGFFPARTAAKLKPVEALRYE